MKLRYQVFNNLSLRFIKLSRIGKSQRSWDAGLPREQFEVARSPPPQRPRPTYRDGRQMDPEAEERAGRDRRLLIMIMAH